MADVSPPSVIVFDVNETLLDIETLEPLFLRLFGDQEVMRIGTRNSCSIPRP